MSLTRAFDVLIKSALPTLTFVLRKDTCNVSRNATALSRYTLLTRCYSNLGVKMASPKKNTTPNKTQTKLHFTPNSPKTTGPGSSRGLSTGASGKTTFSKGKGDSSQSGAAKPMTRSKLQDEEERDEGLDH